MKAYARIALLLAAVLFVPGVSAGEMYRWVDENGTVHFSQSPPVGKQVELVPEQPREPLVKGQPTPSREEMEAQREEERRKREERERERGFPVVELYVTAWCPHCQRAQAFLDQYGVPYEIYDVEREPRAEERRQELSGRSGVPVALIGGQVLRGFSEASYRRALGLN